MTDWLTGNQYALAAELARIAGYLAAHPHEPEQANRGPGELPEPGPDAAGAPALEALVAAFGLSPFERDVLLLCAGCELEARFAGLCAQAGGDDQRRRASFGLALAALPGGHWSALVPAGPLRRWRLVELDAGETIATRPLRIDERVLHHLLGLSYLDPRLAGLIGRVTAPAMLPASQEQAATRTTDALAAVPGPAAILICGADERARSDIATYAYAMAGLQPHVIGASHLPTHPDERELLARLWEREAVLAGGGLQIEVEDDAPARRRSLAGFVETLAVSVILTAPEPIELPRCTHVRVEASRPSSTEQRQLWRLALGERADSLNGAIDGLVDQFDLGAQQIADASANFTAGGQAGARELWRACRVQARPGLDNLAQRIEPLARWEDLVLPADQVELLREVAAHVRRRRRVYEDWGFATKSSRGLGVSALFEGPSGTGKTMAAEVLANELELDLYRIDLSQVISKYIGETEKNLRRVFDAAESGAAILLFDEADALFGKRSEVKDSHDRYANVEVSYLLQRMEDYRGLAILTTNIKDAIDRAFMRRIRFVVRFPFPGQSDRAAIWRRAIPEATPTDGVQADALARLSVAGGSIRNIALGAAFLAADEGESLGMSHLARAAQRECLKLGRPLSQTEVPPWA